MEVVLMELYLPMEFLTSIVKTCQPINLINLVNSILIILIFLSQRASLR